MRKLILLFILFSGLFGLSNAFTQTVNPSSPLQKDNKNTITLYNQYKNLSSADAQERSNFMDNVANLKKTFRITEKGLVWKPDTIITYKITDGPRYSSTSEENENLMSVYEYDLRYTFTFGGNGNILTDMEEYWENGGWINYFKANYTYNSNGNPLTGLMYEWENGTWVNYVSITITYDGNGNELTFLVNFWENGVWVPGVRYTTTYDSNGNMLTEISQVYESGVWNNDSRYSLTYNANGNKLSELVEYWGVNNWENAYQYTYTYNSTGAMLTKKDEIWENGTWVNEVRLTFTNDANGNRLTALKESWTGGTWENHSKSTFTYNGVGNMVQELVEYWSDVAFYDYARALYTYDAYKNSTIGTFEYYYDNVWNLGMGALDLYSNQMVVNDFYDHRYEASFRSFTTGIATMQADNSILIYPNPATDQISITLSDYSNTTIEIFNILGQLCHTQILQSDKSEINIANLPSGLYLLKINNQTRTDVKKFIKK